MILPTLFISDHSLLIPISIPDNIKGIYQFRAQPAGKTIVHLPFIVEGGADGCAELCVFGDMEVDVIEAFQHGIDFFALG